MNIEAARVALADIAEKRTALETKLVEIRDGAKSESRDLTDDESRSCDEGFTELEKLDAEHATRTAAIEAEEKRDARLKPAADHRDLVPATEARHARPRNADSEAKTYRPDHMREANFWADMLDGGRSIAARERLERNTREALDVYGARDGRDYENELRAMGTASTAGGDFLPPLYLSDLWVHPNMAGRPLADRLPKYPLPPNGISVTIPSLASGVSAAARASGGTVSTTDGVTATVSHTVEEYAGLVDIDRIAVMRSDPGLQSVLTQTLVRRYNVAVDVDLISGSGTAPHHKGLDTVVTGSNDVTWTQGTPTPAKFLSQIQKAIAQIDQNRIEVEADLVVMHGRRMAWGAQPNASTFALFQQGTLFHTQGTQDGGFIQTVGGLEVLRDNNITVTNGSSTNEDRVYVLASQDFLFAEGPLYARVHEDVGSGTGTIRFAVFAHSLFLSGRYPSSVSRISGTGLVSPAFDS